MFRKRHPPIGAKPGTLLIHPQAQPPTMRVLQYAPDQLAEHDIAAVADLPPLLTPDTVSWIDVQGVGDERVLRDLADVFQIHPLALEDVVNVPQRPKAERYDEHTLAIVRMARLAADAGDQEQVSLFVGPNYVLTFQERSGDVFDAVRDRIRQGGPVLRSSGPGYLAYALLDAVIDGYYPIIEHFGDQLEALEESIVARPGAAVLHQIHHIKRELLSLRRAIWPLREAVNALIRDEDPLISERVRLYLRDCYDHCVQLIDVIETYRELAGGLLDVYLSSIGNRQNEVMKVLTIMASIFIPLTFMAGIYGMNFDHMPELHWRFGYPTFWILVLLIGGGMFAWFKRKRWL